jgi:predicted dehydrogenase
MATVASCWRPSTKDGLSLRLPRTSAAPFASVPASPQNRRLQRLATHVIVAAARSAPAAAADEEASPPTRIAVIGLGWWSTTYHLPQLDANPVVSIAAVVDIEPGRREAVAQKYGATGYATVAEMVAAAEGAGSSVDGAVIGSAHVAHFENALECVQAGIPVLVEKPMTVSAQQARTLMDEATSRNVDVSVNNTANFNRNTDRAAALVVDGKIGEVRHVVCTMAGDLADLFGSKGDQSDLVTDLATGYRPLASTWSDPKRAGGCECPTESMQLYLI